MSAVPLLLVGVAGVAYGGVGLLCARILFIDKRSGLRLHCRLGKSGFIPQFLSKRLQALTLSEWPLIRFLSK